MEYAYKTCIIYPKGIRVSGDDQSVKIAESLEQKSNELGKNGWCLTSVTPTLINGGAVTKLLLTFRKKSKSFTAKKNELTTQKSVG